MLDRASARLAAVPTCAPAAHSHRAVSARRRRRRGGQGARGESARQRAARRLVAGRVGDAAAPRGHGRPATSRSSAPRRGTSCPGQDLYAEYPAEHTDRFKYSPTFALLFAPFAWLPWPLALLLWNVLNALLLFVAVERVLPPRRALLALALLLLEVLRGMQNAQSNALVAALIILAFVAMERRRSWRAALAVALGACVKIFPLAALTFAIAAPARDPHRCRRRRDRRGARRAAAARPLARRPRGAVRLVARRREHRRAAALVLRRWSSCIVRRASRWPNWPIQLAGTLRAARAARAPARSVGRRALPAALSLLRAALRGAVQSSGGARELSHRVHGRAIWFAVRAARAMAHRAVRRWPCSRSRSCPRSCPAHGCARRR